MAEGKVKTGRNKASGLRKELEKTLWGCKTESLKVERLQEEVNQLELQLLERSMEQDLFKPKLNCKLLTLRGVSRSRTKTVSV